MERKPGDAEETEVDADVLGEVDAPEDDAEGGQDDATEGQGGEEGEGLLADEAADDEAGSRKESRVTKVIRQTKEERNAERARAEAERQRADALDRELARYRAQDDAAQFRMTAEQEAAEVAKLPPEQQVQYHAQKFRREQQQMLQQLEFQRVADLDRAEFLAQAAKSPRRQEFSSKVEEAFQKHIRSAPVHTNRETIYYLLLGMETDRKLQGERRKVASEGLKKQQVSPPSPRGNVGGGRAQSQLSAREREEALDSFKF